MENLTLEREFEEYKALHKYAILKAKLMAYYTDLNAMQGITLPSFIIREQAEKQADEDLKCILLRPDALQRFNSLYNIAWDSMAELMD